MNRELFDQHLKIVRMGTITCAVLGGIILVGSLLSPLFHAQFAMFPFWASGFGAGTWRAMSQWQKSLGAV